MDMRAIRLRGLKTGDVRRYIEWTNQPFYLQRRDQENAGLEPVHLASLKFSDALTTRWLELGVLSYAESASEYELVKSVQKRPAENFISHFPPFLYRRSGELILLPQGVTVVRKGAEIGGAEGTTFATFYLPGAPSSSAVFLRFLLENERYLASFSSPFTSTTF